MDAFHRYGWYSEWMEYYLSGRKEVFLVPCAATKPIYLSSLHQSVYQKFAFACGRGRELLVVSEPVVLIRYQDLYDYEKYFLYDFPPKLLDEVAHAFFVKRLRVLLSGKKIYGCLPRHHAGLINEAVGCRWKNYWSGDLYDMKKKAFLLSH